MSGNSLWRRSPTALYVASLPTRDFPDTPLPDVCAPRLRELPGMLEVGLRPLDQRAMATEACPDGSPLLSGFAAGYPERPAVGPESVPDRCRQDGRGVPEG